MAEAVAADYEAVVADAEASASESEVVRRRVVARLRRELQRIGRRDFFPPAEREHGPRRGGAGWRSRWVAAMRWATRAGDPR